MFFRMVYKSGQIFLPFCHNTRVWQTDGQTEFSSQYRVCITCSAVKIHLMQYSCDLLGNSYQKWR